MIKYLVTHSHSGKDYGLIDSLLSNTDMRRAQHHYSDNDNKYFLHRVCFSLYHSILLFCTWLLQGMFTSYQNEVVASRSGNGN